MIQIIIASCVIHPIRYTCHMELPGRQYFLLTLYENIKIYLMSCNRNASPFLSRCYNINVLPNKLIKENLTLRWPLIWHEIRTIQVAKKLQLREQAIQFKSLLKLSWEVEKKYIQISFCNKLPWNGKLQLVAVVVYVLCKCTQFFHAFCPLDQLWFILHRAERDDAGKKGNCWIFCGRRVRVP